MFFGDGLSVWDFTCCKINYDIFIGIILGRKAYWSLRCLLGLIKQHVQSISVKGPPL